jgi:hypothetical protein
MSITKQRATEIVTELITKAYNRLKQELAGENEEFLDRVLVQYRSKLLRHSWRISQQWCKWDDEGPVLMPDYTRIYYRKGSTEVLLQEFPPQIRLLKFKGSLVNRLSSTDRLETGQGRDYNFSLALPYTIFIFKFVEGLFVDVRCVFCDRPLRRLEEQPLRPYFSNLDSNLSVCLGGSFDRSQLVKDNVAQQSAYVLNHFWQSVFSDEWSSHFWATRSHFQQNNDTRMVGLQSWEAASEENPLFVVEDVNWLPHQEEDFGDIIVRMFDDDANNSQYADELYNELVDEFFEDLKKTYSDNVESLEERISESLTNQLADLLLEKL